MGIPSDKVAITIIIDKDVKETLEKYSGELGMSVSKFASNCIYVALDDYKILKKMGVVRMCLGFRSLIESFSAKGEVDVS